MMTPQEIEKLAQIEKRVQDVLSNNRLDVKQGKFLHTSPVIFQEAAWLVRQLAKRADAKLLDDARLRLMEQEHHDDESDELEESAA